MPEVHIKIEETISTGKVEVTVTAFDTPASTTDSVTIYNAANDTDIQVRVYFPGVSALAVNPIDIPANSDSGPIDVSAPAGTYNYIISATLANGGTVVLDPRFIIT